MQPGYLLRNRYSIKQPLASGYFGETYLAIDCDYYQRYVIVKHLKPQSQDPALLPIARRLFETEAMALRKLGDLTDRIPTLYAYFEEQGEFYLVQEFIEGETLSQELANGKLSTIETIGILREILTGLSIVHNENTIHRDLKPDNIIRRSSDRALVLIDFGAVKEVRKAALATPTPKTLASIGFGTEGYMPSEQAMGFPKLASDIYAVGAIGIECLTGKEPHVLFDEEMLEFKWRHLYQTSNPKLDPLIGRLVMVLNKMLQQRYLDRYNNATEALAAIEPLVLSSVPRQSSSIVSTRGFVKSIDRATFLKSIGLGGFALMSSLSISQLLRSSNDQSIIDRRIGSELSGENPPTISQPTRVEFRSVKLNDRGDIIDRPQSQAQIFQEDLDDGVLLTMVKIPAGTFLMGSPTTEEGCQPEEQPQHPVNIPEFYLGQTLVTQAQWAAIFPDKFVGDNPNSQLPVYSINWLDAIDFCDRLSQKTGRNYRLPSESEWEYACRAETTTPFAYGDTIAPTVVNYDGEHPYAQAPQGELRQKVTPVGTLPPNLFGLYDMHGNLWEWCLDEWFDRYHDAPTNGSAMGDIEARDGQQLRVVRGGSWFSHGCICRSASRANLLASFRHNYYGLRVVCNRLEGLGLEGLGL
jgi:eukaryotic-like serine/threonine-protein kinase